jgi:formylglycine-generating enzyme required for sulfatase activity
LANIPDFDFQSIGKAGRDQKAKNRKGSLKVDEIVRTMSRTTVRIETMRMPSEPATASTGPAESKPDRQKSDAHRPPASKQPDVAREPPAKEQDDPIALAKVNEELLAAQRQELQFLAVKGITTPEGMVLIPAGEFFMGEENGHPDARPMHRTTLSAYWIDTHEVTNAQYRQCVAGGVCSPPKDRQTFDDAQRSQHPVTNVTWKQAYAYCQWRGKRLPTEAEWEKAARGTDGRRYPWGNSEEAIKTWVKDRSVTAAGNGPSAVGSLPDTASPYGVFDLVGNVWEWVRDWYAEDYYATAPRQDPQGPLRGSFRVLRGGDWRQGPLELRASTRAWDEMTYWGPTLGFRCAGDLAGY